MYTRLAILLLLSFSLTFAPTPAEAGCGCDHPPPIRGVVYPRFAPVGGEISIHSPNLKPDTWIKISGQEVHQYLPTDEPEAARVIVPPSCSIGPVEIEIFNQKGDRLERMSKSEFTVLPKALPIYERQATYLYEDVVGAVDTSGTLLVPFDLAGVLKPMQFFVSIRKLPLRFTTDELLYYNKDQYNLKLFQYLVSGPEDYQWGAYYGSTLEKATDPSKNSDVIGYWRHEFESYTMAHLPGGTFEVQLDGRHPDGSLHVDHANLILAIAGKVSDSGRPYDQSRWKPLQAGVVKVDVEVRQILVDTPKTQAALTISQLLDLGTVFLVKTDPEKGVVSVIQKLGIL